MGIEIKPNSNYHTKKEFDHYVSSLLSRLLGLFIASMSMSIFIRLMHYNSKEFIIGFVFTLSVMIYECYDHDPEEDEENQKDSSLPKMGCPPKARPLPNKAKIKEEPLLKLNDSIELLHLQRTYEEWLIEQYKDKFNDGRVKVSILSGEKRM